MGRRSNDEAHMTIDSGSAVPAAVRLLTVVHPHGDHVGFGDLQVRSKIELEAGVAIRMRPQLVPIQVYGRVLVHAVELNANALALPAGLCLKSFSIPTRTCRKESSSPRGWVILLGCSFDAPVVREVHGSPGSVVERRRLRAAWISEEELPVEVRCELLPRGLRCSNRHRGNRGRGQTDCNGSPECQLHQCSLLSPAHRLRLTGSRIRVLLRLSGSELAFDPELLGDHASGDLGC